MKTNIKKDREKLKKLFDKIITTDSRGNKIHFDEALEKLVNIIVDKSRAGGKLLFIGNGGSASIASHMATDFCKNACLPAIAFNDSSLLTCISNDLGYEYVFEKPIELFSDERDVLFAISSSGKSMNILRGVKAARIKKTGIITLSGFKKNNPLRKKGDINFYVPSTEYGHVEIAHLSICHCLADIIIRNRLNLHRRNK